MRPIDIGTGEQKAADQNPVSMHVIGITGGVGAGKSTILNFLKSLPGTRVEEADRIGHLVMEPGTDCFRKIREHFGGGIISGSGQIDRPALSRIVFADKEKLDWLNHVVHPAVKEWFRREIRAERERGRLGLFVIEAALLIEDQYQELCEEFWYVYTDPQLRRERLKASRGYSDEKIDSVFRNQQTDAQFRMYCQEVIDNSGSPEQTVKQVRELLEKKGLYEGKGDSYR